MLSLTLTSAEANSSEEPGAEKLHAGIREGAVRQLAVLPRRHHYTYEKHICITDHHSPGALLVWAKPAKIYRFDLTRR
jgi:hypothetical protein